MNTRYHIVAQERRKYVVLFCDKNILLIYPYELLIYLKNFSNGKDYSV